MIRELSFVSSCEVAGARYSISLTIKLPLIPSRCRTSSTIDISSLQYEMLVSVISVRYLNFTPLLLASTKDLFIDSIPIANDGLVESIQVSTWPFTFREKLQFYTDNFIRTI